VAQDYAVAAVWLKQAADINHPGAQVKLGYLYVTGQGVPQNHEQARHWFQMAAWQGDKDAAHNLDVMDEQGLGQADSDAAPAPVPMPLPASESAPESASASALTPAEGPAWIFAQDPEHYTIQVVALRAPDKLYEFIDRFPEWAPFAIYRPKGNERPLWVLVQGDYPNVEAARAAVREFPTRIQKREKLWIRKFGMVQGMIE
jgi:septal ring-binding cell division protein DamX